ncbi:MAG TPA: YdjY domain-containing protein [Pirellulales bacterium]|nr:YdjY domain-containing protein [Pirellulales bacterium]
MRVRTWILWASYALLALGMSRPAICSADEADKTPSTAEADGDKAAAAPSKPVRLSPTEPIWIDRPRNRVIVVGKVALREGQLEMFACTEGTKEHESILSVPVEAFKVHAALVHLGADPGRPVQFVPEYRAANGPIVDISLYWTDESGQRRTAWAQDWVEDARTGKSLSQPWIFAGSGYWVDEKSGKRDYLANHGDFICVSNFSSAMLDLPIESTDKAGQLLFTAFTDRIPPRDTKVTIVLSPRLKKKEAPAKKGE